MTVRSRENFQFKIGQQTEDGEVMCETRLSFLSQKAQLRSITEEELILFYTKNSPIRRIRVQIKAS